MRKFLLTLTAGIITLGAASTAARADWDDHRPVVVLRAPAYPAPYYPAPVYAPPVYAAPVYPPVVYRAPVYDPDWRQDYWRRHQEWERAHHWHDNDDHHDGW
jgi:hypothetical protein